MGGMLATFSKGTSMVKTSESDQRFLDLWMGAHTRKEDIVNIYKYWYPDSRNLSEKQIWVRLQARATKLKTKGVTIDLTKFG